MGQYCIARCRRRLSSSVTHVGGRSPPVRARGRSGGDRHCKAGQYGYLPSGRLLVHKSSVLEQMETKVPAAADRPARHRGSAYAKYSVSHHITIKPFLLLGLAAEYRSRRWVWLTAVRRPSEVYDTHRRTKLTTTETISRSRYVENRRLNLPHFYLSPVVGDPL